MIDISVTETSKLRRSWRVLRLRFQLLRIPLDIQHAELYRIRRKIFGRSSIRRRMSPGRPTIPTFFSLSACIYAGCFPHAELTNRARTTAGSRGCRHKSRGNLSEPVTLFRPSCLVIVRGQVSFMPRIPLNSVPTVIRGCELRADSASGYRPSAAPPCRPFFRFYRAQLVPEHLIRPIIGSSL